MLDFNPLDRPVAQARKVREELHDLGLEGEFISFPFAPWIVIRAELDLAHHARRQVEDRLPVTHDETFNTSEPDLPDEFQETFLCRRQCPLFNPQGTRCL